MGIQGLIPFLDKVSSRIHVSEFKGQCAAVDAYCWLHKGAYTCAEKLARGEECVAYVYYCMKYVNMLLSHNIKPILVFDGRYLPAKAGTEKKRRETRETNRKTAAELLKAGRSDEARNYLRRSIDVTHAMALSLIQACRKSNIDCIVAPYEADAQLAYLNLQNIAQLVITEDSDLILFGCTKVVFKLDLQGYGLLVERDRLYLSMRTRPENFSFDSFRYMCILSGCDYLPSLPGIGLGKALKFISKTRDPDIHRALQRLPSYLNMTQLRVSEEYRDSFIRADATFRYQPVFDPRTRTVVPLTEPPDGEEVPPIVHEKLPQTVALDLALGNLDPFSLSRVDNFNPDCPHEGILALQKKIWNRSRSSPHVSIWSQDFSGFQPSIGEDKFPGTLNKMAILDVTPLRPPKRLKEIEEEILPSQADLVTMYGKSLQTSPRVKKHCPSPTKMFSDNPNVPSGNSEALSQSSSCPEYLEDPSSQELNQKKLLNPFAKPKPAQATNIGPVGVTGHPNFFSALRKFDGYNPAKLDENKIVVSRTKEEIRDKTLLRAHEMQENDVSEVLDINNEDCIQKKKMEEDLVIAGYSNNKENIFNDGHSDKRSVLETIEEIQLQGEDSDLCEESLKKDDANVCEIMDVGAEEEKTEPVKPKPASAFDWSQFVSRKMQSSPKLSSSQAALKTFKNPFRKQVSARGNESNTADVPNFFKTSVKTSTTDSDKVSSQNFICSPSQEVNKSMEVVFLPQELECKPIQSSSKHSMDSKSPETNKIKVVNPFRKKFSAEIKNAGTGDLEGNETLSLDCLNEIKIDTGFGSSQSISSEALALKEAVKSVVDVKNEKTFDNMAAENSKKEISPSEDALWEQLKQRQESDEVEVIFRGSPDSGCSSIPEGKPINSGSFMMPGHQIGSQKGKSRNTPVARRIGLGRSSAPSTTSQKQNLLAQYGFSKKRKLMH